MESNSLIQYDEDVGGQDILMKAERIIRWLHEAENKDKDKNEDDIKKYINEMDWCRQ